VIKDSADPNDPRARQAAAPLVVALKDVDFAVAPYDWPFARKHEADIAAHFAQAQRIRSQLFNGRVLLVHQCVVDQDTLRGTFFETDFASFMAWRDWGFPDSSAYNCFAMGAIRTADGAYLLGEMGAHTSSGGHIYFSSGTPDRADIAGDRVDLAGSVVREVREETGLDPSEYEIQSGWAAVFAGAQIALMRTLRLNTDAGAAREKILRHLRQESQPELSDIHVVRRVSDLNDRMPRFMHAFLCRALAV
jgi:hypothetical protein